MFGVCIGFSMGLGVAQILLYLKWWNNGESEEKEKENKENCYDKKKSKRNQGQVGTHSLPDLAQIVRN